MLRETKLVPHTAQRWGCSPECVLSCPRGGYICWKLSLCSAQGWPFSLQWTPLWAPWSICPPKLFLDSAHICSPCLRKVPLPLKSFPALLGPYHFLSLLDTKLVSNLKQLQVGSPFPRKLLLLISAQCRSICWVEMGAQRLASAQLAKGKIWHFPVLRCAPEDSWTSFTL